MGAGLVGGLGRMICSSWTSGSLRGRVNGIYLLEFSFLGTALPAGYLIFRIILRFEIRMFKS